MVLVCSRTRVFAAGRLEGHPLRHARLKCFFVCLLFGFRCVGFRVGSLACACAGSADPHRIETHRIDPHRADILLVIVLTLHLNII